MPRLSYIGLLLFSAALSSCVPAEYRDNSDLAMGVAVSAPEIVPLHSLDLPDTIDPSPEIDQQTSLAPRNATLAERAAAVSGTSTNTETDVTVDDRATALRDRAQLIRTRE